jgi:hypothetical protein
MQKTTIGFLLLIAVFLTGCKKNSSPGYSGPTHIYIGGNVGSNAVEGIPCYWKDSVRVELSTKEPTRSGYVLSIDVSGEDVYTAGLIEDSTGQYRPCMWKNNVRTDLSEPSNSVTGIALSVFVSGSNAYVAGYIYDGKNLIPCYWKNGVRHEFSRIPNQNAVASCIKVAGNVIYASGHMTDAAGDTHPYYWNNGARTDFDGLGEATSLFISGNDVFVSGQFLEGNEFAPAYWENGNRTDLSRIDITKEAETSAVWISEGDVYVTGFTRNSSNVAMPCYWKNGTRTDLSAEVHHGGGASCIVIK